MPQTTLGTEVDKPSKRNLGDGAYVERKNAFEVTTPSSTAGKRVLWGAEDVVHFKPGAGARPPERTIELMYDGLGKSDAFSVSLNRDTGIIRTVPYHGVDKDGCYKGEVKELKDPALAAKIEEVWKQATTPQPGKTEAVITGANAKALADVMNAAEAANVKAPPAGGLRARGNQDLSCP